MTTTKATTKAISLLLVVLFLIGLVPMTASAASIEDGSASCTVAAVQRNYFLWTTAGTALGASSAQYTTNDGIVGPAYCIDHGLNYASQTLPIEGKYTSSPPTAGAFANGYPQHDVSTFLGLYLASNPILSGLTEAEFSYATQLAIWATLGQLGVEGTAFTSGREIIAQPTADTQQMRVFRAVQLILAAAATWDRIYQTGMYIRTEEDALGGNCSIPADMTLEYAADAEQFGFKREVIGGKTYFTKEYIFASATSTYYSGYKIELWCDGAPSGYMFTDLNNNELPHGTFREQSTWELPVANHNTTLNENGFEYVGTGKLCIPTDTVPNSGEITIRCGAYVMQYQIYLAKNAIVYEQSYIIADPSKGTMEANCVLNWGGILTETGSLQVKKVANGGMPLAGAKFTLTGTDGSSRTGVTDDSGIIVWDQLNPSIQYTLTETEAPAGYAIVDPINVQVKAARVNYLTVQDSTQKCLTVRKIDRQNGYSLGGCVIAFEQIDGSFRTTGTTDQAGIIQMDADQLPVGSYRVYEVTPPEGYELDDTIQTVNWDGRHDVTLTFNNIRKPTLIIYKCDAGNNYSIGGATFEVYKDGALVTTVTTNDSGLAYVPGITTGYYTVKEIVAPAGYVLDTEVHGINVDLYDPATTDDPRITVRNAAMPSLRIVKYDAQTMQPLANTTFDVYRDTTLVGRYTTDSTGQIILHDLQPGTYLVREVAVTPSYVVNSSPQEVELTAGEGTVSLVFLNYLKPGIHMVKLDAETYEPLANAKFKISRVEAQASQEYVTDANGEIDLSGLEPGTYHVQEILAPDGYLVDDAERIMTINAGETAQFVFTDTRKPSLIVVKYDANLDKQLPGATFRVSKIEDGSHYLDRITGTDGTFRIDDLEPGVYSVVELEAPAGYVKNDTEYHVELFAGRTSQLVVNNEAKPDLKIIKKDADTGELLAGAVFTVKKADSETVTTLRTNANGEILLEDLDPGVYQVTETTPPEGYLPAQQPTQLITLVPNRLGTVIFENHVKPGLTVKKLDTITGDPIKGARFQVIYASSNTFTGEINDLGVFYSDDNGRFNITDLQDGWYRVREIEPAAGYAVKDADTQDFFIHAGESKTVIFENTPLSAIIIQKADAENGEPLQGAWFRIRYLGGTSGTSGTTIGEYMTSSNGTIVVTGLSAGTYIVEEISAPQGYVISDNAAKTVFLSGEDQDVVTVRFEDSQNGSLLIKKIDAVTHEPLADVEFKVTYSDGTVVGNSNGNFKTDAEGTILIHDLKPGVTIVAKEVRAKSGYVLDDTPQTAKIKSKETVTLEFRNAPYGSLIISKKDAITHKPISGVKFQVTTVDGTAIGTNGGIYKTDAAGTITINDLKPGITVVAKETEAKTGYVLDDTPKTALIKSNEAVTLEFLNAPQGNLCIVKKDAASGEPLSDVEFLVTYSDGAVVGNANGHYTTDASGSILISNLEPDVTIIARELTAKRGYVLDDTPQNIKIKSGETVTLEFRNQPKGTLIVEKFDSVTKQPLAGAKFRITTSAGTYVADSEGQVSSNGQYETNAEGQIILSLIEPDTYVVTEVEAPEFYKLDAGSKTVAVAANDTQTLRFYDEPLCTLTLRKLDSVTKKPLANAEFTVKYSDGRLIGGSNGKFLSNRDGEVIVSGLEPNAAVVVTETRAPTGYIRDEQPQTIVVRSGEVNTLTFDNEPTTTLIIRKYIEGTDYEPLSGVGFKVIDGSGAAVGPDDGVYYTDHAGEIVLTGLEPGTVVKAREFKTVDGYVLDGTPQDIQIKEGEVQQLTFWNKRQGALTIRKLDSVTHAPLEGVTFKITTATGAFVPDASGKISSNGLYYTDKAGEIIISGVTGTLVVTEVETIPGYTIHEATRSQTVVVDPEDTQTLTFYNDPTQSVVIQKYITGTTQPLAGVTFLITYGNGTPVGGGNGEYVTDTNGRIVISGLPAGTTIVAKEIRTVKGYALNSTPQTITVSGAPSQVVTVAPATVVAGTGDGELTFYDDQLNTLTIHKYVEGTQNEPLAGVEFKVTDGSGAAIGNSGGVFYTDKTGSITIKDLEAGTTVTVRETKTVDGYVLDGTPQTIEIKGSGEANELTFWNSRQGALVIKKLDSVTGKPLAGVEFKVVYADGRYVDAEGGKLSSNGVYKTDANGEIRITGLTGTIVVTEEQTLPGYTIEEGSRTQTVVVREAETQTLTFYNSPAGGLQIIKSDEDTGERIQGVQFEIRKINGENLGKYTTDRNGIIYLPQAESGWYTITELKAADGYELDPTPANACVTDGMTTTVEITNKHMSSLMIHKVDADTNEGIYGVTFILYDAGKNPIGEYVTDQYGYVYIRNELKDGKYYLRELEAAEGYILDTEYKTIYIERGKCAQIEWKNKAITGQIQVRKYSSADNTITGTPAGSELQGAVYEITQARSGRVVGYIVTDAHGVAASSPLPLGRYFLTEVSAPKYYQLSGSKLEAEIEYAGQIIKLTDYDKPVELGVTIKKIGNREAQPGSYMRYDFFDIANTSNVALNDFFWHDRIPTDAVTATSLTTGTYNQRLYYRITFKTNLNDYRVLASNLFTGTNYSVNLSPTALGLVQGEYVTDIRFEFGTVASGFASTVKPTIQVMVNDNVANGYQITNRADVGGQYLNEWQSAKATWVTVVYRFEDETPLPKTGY